MDENISYEKYLIFSIREKQYAIPSRIINEVAALEKTFPLPLVPEYVKGIINRYSVPFALIDICFLLSRQSSNAKKLIVLKKEVDSIAFLIDDVTDIADISAENLMKIEQENTNLEGLVSNFFEWKNNQVFCLETTEIINRIKRDFGKEAV